jgi:hypothetical protein
LSKNYDYKKTTCSNCGRPAWKRKDGSAPVCRDCRRPNLERVCGVCGGDFKAKDSRQRVCSRVCSGKLGVLARKANPQPRTRSIPTEWTARTRRRYREAVTPGLSTRELRDLARRYVETGATCAYCPSPAETVDHVFPMSRGGTSHEGNLVPCCKWCNSSKADLLLIEWKMGKPHGRTWMDRPWMDPAMPKSTRPQKGSGKPRMVTNPHRFRMLCPCCITPFVPERVRSTCASPACQKEYIARCVRDKYRANNGLEPKGLDHPTKPWIRKHVIPYAASM